MKDEINLGVSPKEMGMGMGSPVGMQQEGGSDKIYPCLHLEGPEDLDLPEHGDLTIHFRRKSETSRVREDGSHWYECCLEVRKLGDVEPEGPVSPTSRDNSTEEALDKLAEALSKRNGDEDDEADEY